MVTPYRVLCSSQNRYKCTLDRRKDATDGQMETDVILGLIVAGVLVFSITKAIHIDYAC